MRNHETGEFELVVGNRQLLSGFFIVVLLFAVAFAMGYVVGQNSPRSTRIGGETAAATPPTSSEAARPPAASAPAPPPEAPALPPDSSAAAAPATEAPPQPVTQAPRVPEPTPTAPVATAPEAPPGSYWQVMAVQQPDAEVVVKTLRDKGFPAALSPGPNNLMRVLVGPYKDTQSMGKAKTELENAGFRPIRK
jgi:cell division septation protein DedD